MEKPNREQTRIWCAVAVLVCAAFAFALIFSAYVRRFDRTLTEENRSRLEEVSGHVAAYMEFAMKQQWRELVIAAEASATLQDEEERIAFLGSMAETLGFEYIGLAGEDGVLRAEGIHKVKDISEEDYFLAAQAGNSFMTGIRSQIFWDRAASGVILSVPAEESGKVVVAMLNASDLGEGIQVDSFEGDGYSYIIDKQGNFVLRSKSMAYNNLFQSMQNLSFEEGYNLDAMRADILSRREGMTSYSDLGVDKYAYYRPLSFSDWTVVSIVPRDTITARTSMLSREMILMCAASGIIFLFLVCLVGVLLLRLESRRRANRAKTDFLANMSHDMRTPMNAVIGMTAIADAHADEPETVRECLRKIDLSSRHLLGLINDVLDMSRIESGKMTLAENSFSLAEVIENAENMVLPRILAKGQSFSVRLHGIKHEYLRGDSLRLSQIVINILTNAMKFTPENGRITLDLKEEDTGEPGTAWLRFVFADSGIGMKQDFLRELFTPFARAKNSRVDSTEGSGLGMAITKRIVDLMNGRIEVKSAEGEGSVFTVLLPLAIDESAPQEALPQGWRILLIGAEEGQWSETAQILEEMGFSSDWTPGLDSAFCRRAGDAWDAVVIDRDAFHPEEIKCFSGVSGRKPVLILAAYHWEDILGEALKAGVEYFIQKPLLRSGLRRVLKKAAGMEENFDSAARSGANFSGKHILLAEDNEINLEIVQAILTEAGASTFWAKDGVECVKMFQESSEGWFDLILMDIQMPRLNGYEAAARIRKLERADASVPILAMSANAYAEDIEAASKSGMNGYLIKPIDVPVWIEEIGRILSA